MSAKNALTKTRREWLAAVLRGERPTWPDAPAGAIGEMMDAADDEGVAALVDQSVRAAGAAWDLPQKFKDALAAHARQLQVLEMLRHHDLVRVLRILATAGIPTLLLKGAALAYSVYAAPWLRPRGDTDLLVTDTEAVECCKPLLAGLEYVASAVPTTTAIAYELVFRHDAESGVIHWIDAHWRASNCAMYAETLPFEELRRDAIALPALGPDARGLGNVHALLLACMHRICNLPLGIGDRLIWLYDIHLLITRSTPAECKRLCDVAIERGLAGACRDGLSAVQAAFATELPFGLLDALALAAKNERFNIGKARSRWYQEWHNLRAVASGKRRAWIKEKLFPHPAYMRALYQIEPGRSLFGAYLRRLLFGSGSARAD